MAFFSSVFVPSVPKSNICSLIYTAEHSPYIRMWKHTRNVAVSHSMTVVTKVHWHNYIGGVSFHMAMWSLIIVHAVGNIAKYLANPSFVTGLPWRGSWDTWKTQPVMDISSNPRRIATVCDFLMQIREVMTETPPLDVCILGDVSWRSKKQKSVALSTVEAKYVALASTAQEVL